MSMRAVRQPQRTLDHRFFRLVQILGSGINASAFCGSDLRARQTLLSEVKYKGSYPPYTLRSLA
jgi:hypothetical protein